MGGRRAPALVVAAFAAAVLGAPLPAAAQTLTAPTGTAPTTAPPATAPGRSNSGAANSVNAPTTVPPTTLAVAAPPPTAPPQPSANPTGLSAGLPTPLAQTAGPIPPPYTPSTPITPALADPTAYGAPPSASAPIDPRLIASPTTSGLVQVLDDLAAKQRDLDLKVRNLEVAAGLLDPSALSSALDPRTSQVVAQEQELQGKLEAARADLRQLEGVSIPQAARSATPPAATALPPASPGTLPRNPTTVATCAATMLAPMPCGLAFASPTPAPARASSTLIRDSAIRFLTEMVDRRTELTRQVRDIQADLEAAHLRLVTTPPPTAASAALPAAASSSATASSNTLRQPSSTSAANADLLEARRQLVDITNRLNVVARAHALSADGRGIPPSRLATSDIPPDYLALYQRAAATCPGLSWTVLAGIGSIESSHGRSQLPGVTTGANWAGAMGPMQFLASSWAAYGVDADGDGVANVYTPSDAIYAAARYLCHDGAGDPSYLRSAIWSYNHADWYVNRVLDLGIRYGSSALDTLAAPATAASLVRNPNISMGPEAVADLLSGTIDQRVINVLGAAALEHRLVLSVIKTGHSTYVKGTDRVSNHIVGRAVDISAVDSVDVTASNYAALDLSLAILTSGPSVRPDEFGSPWLELTSFAGAFSDDDHSDHLHIGWNR